MLEVAYEACLCYELDRAGIAFRRQAPLPLEYEGVRLDRGYIADIIMDEQVVLEIKSVECVLPVHEAQLLTYLKIGQCSVGLLINFNTVSLTDGITRRVL